MSQIETNDQLVAQFMTSTARMRESFQNGQMFLHFVAHDEITLNLIWKPDKGVPVLLDGAFSHHQSPDETTPPKIWCDSDCLCYKRFKVSFWTKLVILLDGIYKTEYKAVEEWTVIDEDDYYRDDESDDESDDEREFGWLSTVQTKGGFFRAYGELQTAVLPLWKNVHLLFLVL